jgi:hypothetical protein
VHSNHPIINTIQHKTAFNTETRFATTKWLLVLGQNKLKNGYYTLCSSIPGYLIEFETTLFCTEKSELFQQENKNREGGGSYPSHSLSDLFQTHDFAVT